MAFAAELFKRLIEKKYILGNDAFRQHKLKKKIIIENFICL